MTTSVTISEVGPRDGLQSVDAVMPTDAKKAWIKAEAEAGVSEIEVGSFVPPTLLPQMADTAEIVAYAKAGCRRADPQSERRRARYCGWCR